MDDLRDKEVCDPRTRSLGHLESVAELFEGGGGDRSVAAATPMQLESSHHVYKLICIIPLVIHTSIKSGLTVQLSTEPLVEDAPVVAADELSLLRRPSSLDDDDGGSAEVDFLCSLFLRSSSPCCRWCLLPLPLRRSSADDFLWLLLLLTVTAEVGPALSSPAERLRCSMERE
jgi:hypothetical protein